MFIVLAIIQGLSEFLPISSTGHLIVISHYFGNMHPGLLFIITVHFGSLLALCLFFSRDILGMFKGFFEFLTHYRTQSIDFLLGLKICIATLPVVIFGFFMVKFLQKPEHTTFIIAINSIIFGVLLYVFDKKSCQKQKSLKDLSFRDSFLIGLVQVCSLLPGASRSGTSITGGRLLGYSRVEATKFGFLLGIPAILGAVVLECKDFATELLDLDWNILIMAVGISFVVSYMAIAGMLKLLARVSFAPFAIYRLILGMLLLFLS
jgi:undecaprenyl-diphosphatase